MHLGHPRLHYGHIPWLCLSISHAARGKLSDTLLFLEGRARSRRALPKLAERPLGRELGEEEGRCSPQERGYSHSEHLSSSRINAPTASLLRIGGRPTAEGWLTEAHRNRRSLCQMQFISVFRGLCWDLIKKGEGRGAIPTLEQILPQRLSHPVHLRPGCSLFLGS